MSEVFRFTGVNSSLPTKPVADNIIAVYNTGDGYERYNVWDSRTGEFLGKVGQLESGEWTAYVPWAAHAEDVYQSRREAGASLYGWCWEVPDAYKEH